MSVHVKSAKAINPTLPQCDTLLFGWYHVVILSGHSEWKQLFIKMRQEGGSISRHFRSWWDMKCDPGQCFFARGPCLCLARALCAGIVTQRAPDWPRTGPYSHEWDGWFFVFCFSHRAKEGLNTAWLFYFTGPKRSRVSLCTEFSRCAGPKTCCGII